MHPDYVTVAETLALVLNLGYVLLAIVQSVWCWPVGFVGASLTFVVFFQAGLQWNAGLQVVYLALMVYGWEQWRRGGEDAGTPRVSRTPVAWWVGLALAASTFTVLGMLLARRMEWTLPFWDAATTGVSLAAQFMTARKWIETWLVWIVVDVVYVAMLVSQGLDRLAVLYLVYAVLAVSGFLTWRRSLAGTGADVSA